MENYGLEHPGGHCIDNLDDAVAHIAYTEGKDSYEKLDGDDLKWLSGIILRYEIEMEDLFSSDYDIDIGTLLERRIDGEITSGGLGAELTNRVMYVMKDKIQRAFESHEEDEKDRLDEKALRFSYDKNSFGEETE